MNEFLSYLEDLESDIIELNHRDIIPIGSHGCEHFMESSGRVHEDTFVGVNSLALYDELDVRMIGVV